MTGVNVLRGPKLDLINQGIAAAHYDLGFGKTQVFYVTGGGDKPDDNNHIPGTFVGHTEDGTAESRAAKDPESERALGRLKEVLVEYNGAIQRGRREAAGAVARPRGSGRRHNSTQSPLHNSDPTLGMYVSLLAGTTPEVTAYIKQAYEKWKKNHRVFDLEFLKKINDRINDLTLSFKESQIKYTVFNDLAADSIPVVPPPSPADNSGNLGVSLGVGLGVGIGAPLVIGAAITGGVLAAYQDGKGHGGKVPSGAPQPEDAQVQDGEVDEDSVVMVVVLWVKVSRFKFEFANFVPNKKRPPTTTPLPLPPPSPPPTPPLPSKSSTGSWWATRPTGGSGGCGEFRRCWWVTLSNRLVMVCRWLGASERTRTRRGIS